MPTIDQNRSAWENPTSWWAGGDDWSESWGGAEAQWYGCVYPRVRRLLPASTVLEIAPGFGRWTQFMVQHCDRLIGVDLSNTCASACRERFADVAHASFHTNDGRSLDMVDDGSIDLAFSMDSLVHAEQDVIEAYLRELAKKLTPDGVVFMHHSNLGEYQRRLRVLGRISKPTRERLERVKILDPMHWRATSVSADSFAAACSAAGLRCVRQELVNWGARWLNDSFSIVVRPGHPLDTPLVRVRNRHFVHETASTKIISQLWQST